MLSHKLMARLLRVGHHRVVVPDHAAAGRQHFHRLPAVIDHRIVRVVGVNENEIHFPRERPDIQLAAVDDDSLHLRRPGMGAEPVDRKFLQDIQGIQDFELLRILQQVDGGASVQGADFKNVLGLEGFDQGIQNHQLVGRNIPQMSQRMQNPNRLRGHYLT